MLKVLLPVGVSFYTFAAISYVVDVYRGMIRPAKSVVHYLAWATLFPYLMAGPIIRYGHVGEQLERSQQRFRSASSAPACSSSPWASPRSCWWPT